MGAPGVYDCIVFLFLIYFIDCISTIKVSKGVKNSGMEVKFEFILAYLHKTQTPPTKFRSESKPKAVS